MNEISYNMSHIFAHMNLNYKQNECRQKNVIEFFADRTESYTILYNDQVQALLESDLNDVIDLVDSLKNGVNILRTCQIISNELNLTSNNRLSCQTLYSTNMIGFILPYVRVDTDRELLRYIMQIIDKLTFITQPEDSPLQNPIFLQNIIEIFKLSETKNKLDALNIINNLLCDECICVQVFNIVSKLNFIQILIDARFFDIEFVSATLESYDNTIENPLFFSSSILDDFSQLYDKESLTCMVPYISLISNNLNIQDNSIRKNFTSALSYILKNRETHLTAINEGVPNNLINSLCYFHHYTVMYVFDCIYRLAKNNYSEAFIQPLFIRLCSHLLETVDSVETLKHILRFLNIFLPMHFYDMDSSIYIEILLTMTERQTFSLRIFASLILIKCLQVMQDQDIKSQLIEKNFFDFIYENVDSYSSDETIFLLDSIIKLFQRSSFLFEELSMNINLQNMINNLANNENDETSKKAQYLLQTYYNTNS